jgi:hypothetical protein
MMCSTLTRQSLNGLLEDSQPLMQVTGEFESAC